MVTARVGQSCALAVASGASRTAIAAAAFALSMLFLPRVRDALRMLVFARDCVSEQRRFQSALIPAARIGFAQRSISARRYLARYSGVRRSGATISRPSS